MIRPLNTPSLPYSSTTILRTFCLVCFNYVGTKWVLKITKTLKIIIKYTATRDEGVFLHEKARKFEWLGSLCLTAQVHIKAMVGPGSNYFPLSFCGTKVGFFNSIYLV